MLFLEDLAETLAKETLPETIFLLEALRDVCETPTGSERLPREEEAIRLLFCEARLLERVLRPLLLRPFLPLGHLLRLSFFPFPFKLPLLALLLVFPLPDFPPFLSSFFLFLRTQMQQITQGMMQRKRMTMMITATQGKEFSKNV